MFQVSTIEQPGSGEFFLPETGRWFTFKDSSHPWGRQHGLPHEVDVLNGTRAARILKTVAHVAVDERADGSPVLQRWDITRCKAFRSCA
jgi:hypothetical protein